VLTSARLLDETGREVVESAAIVVEDGTIRDVATSNPVPWPSTARVIDCRGHPFKLDL
jgi:cytosine/adenosine deaminase-related metal-dependent hydrolase